MMDINYNLFTTDKPANFYEMFMKNMMEAAEKKRSDFIQAKIKEKGYAHLLEGIEKRIFPGIAAIKHEGWSYYYADNGTDNGHFIVAIQDWTFEQKTNTADFATTMDASFKWQDREGLDLSKIRYESI